MVGKKTLSFGEERERRLVTNVVFVIHYFGPLRITTWQ
jgi:hypothetical protein